MSDMGALIGRALLAVIFIASGFGKLTAVHGIAAVLARKGFPYPIALGYAVGAIELVGGLMILCGVKTRYVALVLFCFTAGTILMQHNFWTMHGAARATNQLHVMKNLAIMGGILLLASFGPGRFSLGRGA
jgi:putative oxidoreductase